MKKFTSLFALLSCLCVVSAQADDFYVPTITDGEVSIFYESDINPDEPYIYLWVMGSNPLVNNGWPGVKMEKVGQNSNGKFIFKWTKTATQDWTPTHMILTAYNSNNQLYKITGDNNDVVFTNNAYYIDGGYNHTVADGSTVYFYNSENWGNVKIYAFDNRGNKYKNNWPGNLMENVGNGLFKYHFDECSYTNIIFVNGNGGGANQTVDLTAENDKVYVIDGTTNNEGSHNTFTVDANLILTDGENFPYNKDFAVLKASYSRAISNQWGTLCLPFAINTVPDGVTFYELSNVNETARTLSFEQISTVGAGQPVVFKAENVSTLEITSNNASVTPTITPVTDQTSGWVLNGSFKEQRVTGTNLYYISNNQFWLSNDYIDIPAYRAWFSGTAMTSPGEAPFRITTDDTEGLQYVEQEDGTVKAYYDLQGRKLDSAHKGLVIENGKIIMVK